MQILAIETSADDTGIAILRCTKIKKDVKFSILANKVHTQIGIHTAYGGIFPMMAKREHGKNIIPTLMAALKEAKMLQSKKNLKINPKLETKIRKVLARENDLSTVFMEFIKNIKKPNIDALAVTVGPGLEPALWVGISVARALSLAWDIPIIPVNHMEGHVLSILPQKKQTFIWKYKELRFPILSLLISGGHTELVLMKDWMKYNIIGSTRDDAVGEAFDKVARMLGLPYPGGPEISKLAEQERASGSLERLASATARTRGIFQQKNIRAFQATASSKLSLPRPMIHSKDYDFSFSGLKTAVLYFIRDLPKGKFTDAMKSKIAKEFEDAIVDVLVAKTIRAVQKYKIKSLIVGGGVSANTHLQQTLKKELEKTHKEVTLHFPTKNLSTDNALMIAIAGYFQYQKKKPKNSHTKLVAKGNLSL